MDKLILSVALCTYNGESFIEEQLSSIYNAAMVPDETIVSDDGSTDATCDIVSRWSTQEPGIQFFRNARTLGVIRNFDQVLSLTRGDIILLCDHDDKWHPDKLTRIVSEFEKRIDLTLLHTDARLTNAEGVSLNCSLFEALELSKREIHLVKSGNAFDALLRRNLVTGATAALRRELLKAALPLPAEWVHDEWLAIIASAIGKVDYVDEKLIDYRQHGRNQIGMRKLSFTEKIGKALIPRGDFHLKQVRRSKVLLERLVTLGTQVPSHRIKMVEEKLLHHQMRAQLPANRLFRIIPVMKEIMNGRYFLYSTGFRSIVRDLLESA